MHRVFYSVAILREEKMGEFKIVEGYAVEVQKKLNQWKHQYKIDILESKFYREKDDASMFLICLIWREED